MQRPLALVRWAALQTAAPPKSAAVGDGRRAPAAPWQLRPPASASRCPTAHCRWGDVGDPRFGDIHFYSYAADAFSTATYPPAKFVSEFGFMSLPSFSGEPQHIRNLGFATCCWFPSAAGSPRPGWVLPCVECCEDGHEAPSAAELSHKQVGVARAQPLHRQASTGSAQPAAP